MRGRKGRGWALKVGEELRGLGGEGGSVDAIDAHPGSCGAIFGGHWKLPKFLKQIDGVGFVLFFKLLNEFYYIYS